MRFVCCMVAAALSPALLAQDAPSRVQVTSVKAVYEMVKSYVTKSAERMPEAKYSFKPSDDVMSYGQVLEHITDSQYYLCGTIIKNGKAENIGYQNSGPHTKAQIAEALKTAFAYCDSIYEGLNDATSAEMVNFFGQQRTKLSILAQNSAHSWEHYGNLATYLRINRIVPPSSEGRGGR